jgi:hypothetical protein
VTLADHLADDLLSALVDEELSPAELQAARAHLAICVECSERLALLRAVKDLLQHLPEVAPPRDFSLGPRVVVDPPNVVRLERWYTATRALAASLAAVFVLLVGGTVYMDTAGAPAQQRAALEVTSSQGVTQNQAAAPTPLAAGASARDAAQAPVKAQQPAAPQAPAAAQAPAGAQPPAAAPSGAGPSAPTPAPAAAVLARSQSATEAQSRPATPTPDSTDLTAAATRVQPLPTRPPAAATAAPFGAPAPTVAPLQAEDPAAPFRAAAVTVGALALLVLLGALVVRYRLARARAPIHSQE